MLRPNRLDLIPKWFIGFFWELVWARYFTNGSPCLTDSKPGTTKPSDEVLHGWMASGGHFDHIRVCVEKKSYAFFGPFWY